VRWAGVAMRERSQSGPRAESKQRNGGATPKVLVRYAVQKKNRKK
jgi:hypothetical protein